MPVAEALRALDAPLTQQPWPTTLFLSGSSNYQIPNTENMIYRSFPYLHKSFQNGRSEYAVLLEIVTGAFVRRAGRLSVRMLKATFCKQLPVIGL